MKAHVIKNGVVVNTILVNSLDFMPNLIDASVGGNIGDTWDGESFSSPEPVKTIPSVSPFQLRLALNTLNLRDAVETLVAASSQEIKDGWEYATEFKRDNAFLLSIQPELGMTDEQIDEVFLLAATLNQ